MSISKEEFFQNILTNIDTHGWHSTYVFDSGGDEPDFTYTVGFTRTLKAPEFIVFGLPKGLMHSMLWEVFRQIKAGKTVTDGAIWSDLLEGFDCVSRRATHSDTFSEYMLSSKWLWNKDGHEGVPEVYQLVWPGAVSGLYPWDEGCDRIVINSQPQLW